MHKMMLAIVALLALGACNTMEGLGQDVSTAGDAVTDQARETQQEM